MGERKTEEACLTASYYTLSGAAHGEPSRYSFEARVHAAAEATFTGIGMTWFDFDALIDGGSSPETMQAVLAETGVTVDELEGLVNWDLAETESAESRKIEDRLFRMTEVFGEGLRIHTGAFASPRPDPETTAARFAGLCDRAAAHGIIVALEPIVVSQLPDLASVTEIVELAARPNGGILLDSYHFYRASDSVAALKAAAELIVAVQLNDAQKERRGSARDDAVRHRLVPGEGDIDLVAWLKDIAAAGVDVPFGVEAMCDDLRTLPVDKAALRAGRAGRSVLAQAQH